MARPRGFDEKKVLQAARDEFWSCGYAATSIDDVAAATGLGKGSLYGAFGDKHALFLRVFDDYCTDAVNAVRGALDGPDSGAYGRLRAHVLAVARSTGNDTDRRGCLLARGTAELAGSDPAVAARAKQTFDAIEQALVGCIEGAQRAGDIDPSADGRQLAGLILAILRGIEALGKAGKSKAALRGIADAALAVLPRS
jgi:TetR/AcrR family transcriptional regulator, transcriptional repressor for nem operon